MKSITQKFVSASITLGVALAGISSVPALTYAKGDNGLHLGATMHAQNKNNSLHENIDAFLGLGGLGLGLNTDISLTENTSSQDAKIFHDLVKPAQKTFKEAVKDAKNTFKDDQKTARVNFISEVKTATDQQGRITAFKTYLNALLTAFKAKSAAIETAFEAFINTNFNTNHAPIADAQSVTLQENTSASITLTGSDQENSPLAYVIVTSTAHGTLSGTDNHLTYTPNANFSGQDSFTFKVDDGSLLSATATVSIQVNP